MVAIPISLVGTFIMMAAFGRNLNVISLAGLAFASGMVVDSSIVVLENIYRRRQEGETRREAAYRGTVQVWGAILASTLTTVAVFLPVHAHRAGGRPAFRGHRHRGELRGAHIPDGLGDRDPHHGRQNGEHGGGRPAGRLAAGGGRPGRADAPGRPPARPHRGRGGPADRFGRLAPVGGGGGLHRRLPVHGLVPVAQGRVPAHRQPQPDPGHPAAPAGLQRGPGGKSGPGAPGQLAGPLGRETGPGGGGQGPAGLQQLLLRGLQGKPALHGPGQRRPLRVREIIPIMRATLATIPG